MVTDGLSTTLLVTGKGMDPRDYGRPTTFQADRLDANGRALPTRWQEWRTATTWKLLGAHTLRVGVYIRISAPGDVSVPLGVNWNDNQGHAYMLAGSPHPGSMPALVGDGSVRSLSYSISSPSCARLWTPLRMVRVCPRGAGRLTLEGGV